MDKSAKIYIAGHRGMVGSALLSRVRADGYANVVTRTHAELDLTRQAPVEDFFRTERPDYVFLLAAKNGGIHANRSSPADFCYENLMIESNVIHAARTFGVRKLLFTASVYAYPAVCDPPIKEESFFSGPPESSSEGYAVAKIAGIELCKLYGRQYGSGFVSAVLPHIYGPGDNFDLNTATVMAALIKRFHLAKKEDAPYVELWGSGKPMREFLFVDDLTDALMFIMKHYDGESHINIGAEEEISIRELAGLIKDTTGYTGEIRYDTSKPDGAFRNKMDGGILNRLGWKPTVTLKDGVRRTREWFAKRADAEINGT
jgi:GDP-L-fucose synthase